MKTTWFAPKQPLNEDRKKRESHYSERADQIQSTDTQEKIKENKRSMITRISIKTKH